MSKRRPPCAFHCVEEDGDLNLCVVFDGMRIARRGYPDTPQARTWISIEPGFVVRDSGPNRIVIEHNGAELH